MPLSPATARAARWATAALLLLAALAAFSPAVREQARTVLDPDRIVLLRTPGGFLEVGAMEKVEEFGWSTRWTCPLIDCPQLLTPTISRIRVQAHYVYRVPLAPEWTLRRAGDRYRLTVPPPQLQEPVAFRTDTLELRTTERGWFSPPAAPNREAVLRHLGPELARRGAEPAYVEAQRRDAEATVREFARKWMLEQGKKADLPIEVVFGAPNPL